MKKYLLLLFSFLVLGKVYATPNNSISISPSATDNTVIKADDENDRNTEISSKYNAHGHTEIATTGDAAYIRYDDTNNKWVLSADGSTGISIHPNAVYIHGNAAKLYIGQPDGGCSACGVDNAGTTFSCVDDTCP